MSNSRVLAVMATLLLGTMTHFQDPPTESVEWEDPRKVSLQQKASTFPLFFLLLRLFVLTFVVFLAVALGVFLFVRVVTFGGMWRVLFDLYGRTWTFRTKRTMILLLVLGHVAKMPFKAQRPPSKLLPPTIAPSPSEFADFVAVAHQVSLIGMPLLVDSRKIERIRRFMIRNHEHSRIKRMLLVMSGVER